MPIRVARAEDAGAVVALLEACALPAAGVVERLDEYLVCDSGGALEGVAGLERHGPSGLLRSVAVAPGARGAGLGRRLCERLLAAAPGRAIDDVYLLTVDAADYFAGLGFERIPRDAAPPGIRASEQFTTLCPASAVLMRRRETAGRRAAPDQR